MVRSAIVAIIGAALAAAPAAAQVQTQGQPQTPSANYPYQEVEQPPPREGVRDILQDTLEAAARAREERRRRERERRERERLEWELRQQQQEQIPPPQYSEPPVAVAPLPEPSSLPDPELNREPVAVATQPGPNKHLAPKPISAPQVASPGTKPRQAERAPQVVNPPAAFPPPKVPDPAPPPVQAPQEVVAPSGPPIMHKVAPEQLRSSPLSRWWPLALLGLGIAAAGGGWSVQQRRVRLARTRSAMSLQPRLDQQAGTSWTTPIKLAAPRISIRTRLEYS